LIFLLVEFIFTPIYLIFSSFIFFLVRIQLQLSFAHYQQCCTYLISYIDKHYTPSQGTYYSPPPSSSSSLLPSSSSIESYYIPLIELLLFHVLVPLHAHDEAIRFLKINRKRISKHEGEISTTNRLKHSERLPQDIREVRVKWIL
jgi:hypothetical protein